MTEITSAQKSSEAARELQRRQEIEKVQERRETENREDLKRAEKIQDEMRREQAGAAQNSTGVVDEVV